MSHTHKIHSQASADAAPSIIRPAGGFRAAKARGLPGLAAELAGPERLCEGGRPRGSHTCPEATGASGRSGACPSGGPLQTYPLNSSTSGQPGHAGSKGFLGQGWRPGPSLLSQGCRAWSHLRGQHGPVANNSTAAGARPVVFPSISSLAHPAYLVGPVF